MTMGGDNGDGNEIPSDEMYFTTTNGSLYYQGNQGDVITFIDGTTYTVSEEGYYDTENVPDGKHKVKMVSERNHGYVGIGGKALLELHNFPTLSTVTKFNFWSNSISPNLVKVPDSLPINITDIEGMFLGASSFNQDISGWDVSSVVDMNYMFYKASSFNQDISNWNVANVTEMSNMFNSAIAFNQDLSMWCVSQITSTPYYFANNTFNWTLPKPVWGTCPT